MLVGDLNVEAHTDLHTCPCYDPRHSKYKMFSVGRVKLRLCILTVDEKSCMCIFVYGGETFG